MTKPLLLLYLRIYNCTKFTTYSHRLCRSENNYTSKSTLCNIFVVDTNKIYVKIITLSLGRFLELMKKNLKTPTKLKGKRKHGFRARTASAGGKKILRRRRKKGRKRLTK